MSSENFQGRIATEQLQYYNGTVAMETGQLHLSKVAIKTEQELFGFFLSLITKSSKSFIRKDH